MSAVREPGDILLLSTYELGHQPLGLASPLAFLERAGFRPAAIDLAAARLDEDAVKRAKLIAISVPMHTALRLGVAVVRRARAWNARAHIVCFGLYAPLNRDYLLSQGVDAVLGGEYEEALVELAERLLPHQGRASKNRRRSDEPRRCFDTPPLGVGDQGEREIGEGSGDRPRDAPEVVLARLDFPVPSRAQLVPLHRYARLLVDGIGGEERVAGYTEASRGCKHMCRHCPIPPVYGGRFFVVPVDIVVEDVRQMVAAGARHVTLGDPDFLNGPRHALAVARAIHAEFPSLTWDATIKIEHILRNREMFAELAACGLVFVVSAVESVSDRVLEILDKGHTRADVIEAISIMRGAGVALRPSLLPFVPWSGMEDYLDLLDFVHRYRLVDAVDPVQLSIRLLLPPGSLLLEHPEMRPHLGPLPLPADGPRAPHARKALDEEALTYRWTHPDPRMDALQREVAALVEEAARDGEDPRATFHRIQALAHAAAGLPVPAYTPPPLGRRSPRLSEAWFC